MHLNFWLLSLHEFLLNYVVDEQDICQIQRQEELFDPSSQFSKVEILSMHFSQSLVLNY